MSISERSLYFIETGSIRLENSFGVLISLYSENSFINILPFLHSTSSPPPPSNDHLNNNNNNSNHDYNNNSNDSCNNNNNNNSNNNNELEGLPKTVNEILATESNRNAFKEYLNQIYCSETIDCYNLLLLFHSLFLQLTADNNNINNNEEGEEEKVIITKKNEEIYRKVEEVGKRIYDDHISSSAPYPVNIDCDLRSKLDSSLLPLSSPLPPLSSPFNINNNNNNNKEGEGEEEMICIARLKRNTFNELKTTLEMLMIDPFRQLLAKKQTFLSLFSLPPLPPIITIIIIIMKGINNGLVKRRVKRLATD